MCLHDLTEQNYAHQQLVKADLDQDEIDDSRKELIENLQQEFHDYDGTIRIGAFIDAQICAPEFNFKFAYRQPSAEIADELDDDGNVLFRRVILGKPSYDYA